VAVSLGQFATIMLGAAQRLPRAINTVVKELARDVDRGVILGTPVDVGTARSNWVVSLSTPQGNFIAAYAPGIRLGRGEKANANAAIAQGLAVINTRQPGQTIWIVNNAPYIGVLNTGYSAQSPALFVETAIISAVRALDGRQLKVI
jgi:hypothetical protein